MDGKTKFDKYKSNMPVKMKNKLDVSSRFHCLVRNGEVIKQQVQSKYAEVEFKGNIKHICLNIRDVPLNIMQYVVVMCDECENVGIVISLGKEAEAKKRALTDEETLKIVRIASENEIARFIIHLEEEEKIVERTKALADKYELEIKVTDAQWQFDKQKLTIFFTAPQRVDFRELVKDLARNFRTRIELRQISSREETKRLGPCVGPCGRELCCTSFLENFDHITLDDAKYQQLSNNISKLSGNCGRLKCCLKYEMDTYKNAYEKYPPLEAIIDTEVGVARISKIDIFKNLVNIQYENNSKYDTLSHDEINHYVNIGKVFMPANVDENGENSNTTY